MARLVIGTADLELYDRMAAEVESYGHTCLWCVDGAEVVDTTVAGHVDAVFVDVNLTVFRGLEAIERLRAEPDVSAHMPLFLLSDDDVDPHVLERFGATARFPKTHDAYRLSEVLTQALGDRIMGDVDHEENDEVA